MVACVVVRRRVVLVHAMFGVHVVMSVAGGSNCRPCLRAARAQHRRRDRAPDGEQDGQQNQNEDAQVLHVAELLRRWSVRAASLETRPGFVLYATARCADRVVLRLDTGDVFDAVASPARPSRMGHSGRSSP